MDLNLLADFDQLRWPAPHHILVVNEDEDEALFPLDARLMALPDLRMEDLDLPIRGQSQPPQDQGAVPIQRPQPNTWLVYKEMNYFGVEEENEEEWNALQLEDGQEEDLEDEIMNSTVSQQDPIDVSLLTKHRDPISNDKQLLRDINPAAAHIATIGLQDLSMPDVTAPVFVSILEPHNSNM